MKRNQQAVEEDGDDDDDDCDDDNVELARAHDFRSMCTVESAHSYCGIYKWDYCRYSIQFHFNFFFSYPKIVELLRARAKQMCSLAIIS